MNPSRRLGTLWILLLLGSCASQEVQVPPERFFQKGFSFMLPNEKGWVVGARTPLRIVLGKRGESPDETLVVEANVIEGPTPLQSNEELLRIAKEVATGNTNPLRFNYLKREFSPHVEKGNNCVRFHITAEDHGVAKRSRKAEHMILEKLDLLCVHPKNKRVAISMQYSQRTYPDQRDPRFLERATSVLNSIEFTDPD